MKNPKLTKATKGQVQGAADQVQHVATVLEEKLPVQLAIDRAIEELERKLANLHHLQKSYLTSSLAVVESARADLEALLGD